MFTSEMLIKTLRTGCDKNFRQKTQENKPKIKFDRTLWRFWLHPVLDSRDRELHLLTEDLKLDHDRFWMYFRMSVGQSEALLQMLAACHVRSSS